MRRGCRNASTGGIARGVDQNRLELYRVPPDELAHYSKATLDVMYRFPMGWRNSRASPIARTSISAPTPRTNTDLDDRRAPCSTNKDSNVRLAIRDLASGEWQVPYVIEPSAGVDRGVLAVLNEGYRVEELDNGSTRTVLRPQASPGAGESRRAAAQAQPRRHRRQGRAIKRDLQSLGFGRVLYEDTGNIGKGYRRHDEVGTPLCLTVDFQTLEGDDTVTVRDRDTMAQTRVAVPDLPAYVRDYFSEGAGP